MKGNVRKSIMYCRTNYDHILLELHSDIMEQVAQTQNETIQVVFGAVCATVLAKTGSSKSGANPT